MEALTVQKRRIQMGYLDNGMSIITLEKCPLSVIGSRW